jgi:hypothetical protein
MSDPRDKMSPIINPVTEQIIGCVRVCYLTKEEIKKLYPRREDAGHNNKKD